MASPRWIGAAPAVAQVSTLTPANVEIGDIFTFTFQTGRAISVTATAGTVANVTGLFTTAWNASTLPEAMEVTAVDSTTAITLTADTAGKPFSGTATAVDGGGANTQTFTFATTTTNAGPNVWSTAANWSTGSVPVNTDTPVIADSAVDILYGLDQSSVTLTSLAIESSFTGKIGLPERNTDSGEYDEYRDTFLKIAVTTLRIGDGEGSGSSRIKINFGSAQTDTSVLRTSQPIDTGVVHAVLLIGTHASNVVRLVGGSVAVGRYGETSTVATLSVAPIATGQASCYCGTGVSLTTITQTGGTLVTNTGATTITQSGGTHTRYGGNVTTLNLWAGTLNQNANGTITTANVGGTLDYSRAGATVDLPALNLYRGFAIIDPRGLLKASTNDITITPVGCSLIDGRLDLGIGAGARVNP